MIVGIFISGAAKIGSNCTIYQHITIGSNTNQKSKHSGAPIIGDNVLIGASATIIGGVKIGSNSQIGAGAVVAMDIPENSVVVSQAPRIISTGNQSEKRGSNVQ